MLITYADHTDMQNMQMNAFFFSSVCEREREEGEEERRSGRVMWVSLNKRLRGGGQRQ